MLVSYSTERTGSPLFLPALGWNAASDKACIGILPSRPRENGDELRDGALSPVTPGETAVSARLAGDRTDAEQPIKGCELYAFPLIKQGCVVVSPPIQGLPLFRAWKSIQDLIFSKLL